MYKRVLRALFYARRIFFAGALTCFALNSSLAAEFTKVPTDDGADIIAVTGHLLSGDEKKFIDVALPSQKALVVFQSPGGNLLAGIEIGKAIHLKGFATLVPDNVECASACALAWLGGRIRFLSDKGRVGFHAVYSDQDGQAAVSSAGNAIVGAYLNQLGLPVVAVVYITSAPPDGIQWLTIPDAQRYGIEVQRANLGTTTNEQSSTVHSSAPAEPGHVAFEDKIKSVTYEFISTTNRPNDQVTLVLGGMYSDQVNYFGKTLAKASVLADKSTFFRRWPNRNYSIRPDTLRVNCQSELSCESNGVVDWVASFGDKVSTGSASFFLGLAKENSGWKISAENSSVITRHVASLSNGGALALLPHYQLDQTNNKLVSLSNLSPDGDCVGALTTGKIVQRQFGNDGLALTGFVLEDSDGSREFINVNVNLGSLDMNSRSWVQRGLQVLLAQGRAAEAYVRLCGAAGRVQMLDAVR